MLRLLLLNPALWFMLLELPVFHLPLSTTRCKDVIRTFCCIPALLSQVFSGFQMSRLPYRILDREGLLGTHLSQRSGRQLMVGVGRGSHIPQWYGSW